MTRFCFPSRLRMSHQSRRLNTSYRRNGKLQSCEPCRKGKLRCDHMMPTCGRCARRNKPEQCVYHPAPLTKTTTLPTPHATESSGSPPSVAATYDFNSASFSNLQFPPFDNTPVYQPRVPRASSLPAQPWSSNHQPSIDDLARRPPCYPDSQLRGGSISFQQTAGFVSHSAILNENESSIGILPPNSAANQSVVSQYHIEKGVAILTLLKDFPQIDKYIDKWFSLTRGIIIIEPMVRMWAAGIWSAWHKVLESQKPEGLRQMSEKVWANTMKPVTAILNQNTTPQEFTTRTTGEDLRWEVVGMILTLIGLLAQSLQDGDPIFCSHDDPPVDRAALAVRMYNASEACIGFCADFDIMNDLYLWLLYEYTVVYCNLHARGSYSNWQKSGYLATALVAFGLHQEIKVDENTPFFMAELRKRLFVSCYENDKFSASFVGRPPRLTRQYCRIQLPLDLSDAQTMSDGLDLDNALSNLDANGWNQRGAIHHCTFARIFASNALITEEILEISLGFLSTEEIVSRAADIEARAILLWENFPSFLRVDPENPWDIKRAPIELLFLAYIRLADLGHHFLLQRTLIKKVGADSTKLLTVSREMFSFILVLTNNRGSLRDFQIDFSQLLCMYGIPSAAVIAVELLHQEQNSSGTSAPLPRSDTIQDLSTFVACLGCVRPESGGYPICDRGRKFLKRILDTILTPAPLISSNSDTEVLGDTSFTTPLFQTGNNGEFMRWLESMEWEQESWVNFNQIQA
ncbi:uncharacterized protein BDR25DRAFT_97671 [Lindgomyces ingoldianus]|uniref:Uncharacterized protein n=1 Tax=Lindgomyces ingoldianus TaxID=673940 RepID=A0ACB6QCZ7_9PLEO|nr:uncharacterized protein BDR25DRAFT_97671 [Lindgomyces ingoldianus]KAF2464247.1 hypothetical protein BDR25DRAFT_97671 [Lindgomyces ingoldianus]